MKKLEIDIVLKESFYEECASPVLPIPLSEEDINTMINGGLKMSVIAENLLQMVDHHPDRLSAYKPLIIYSFMNAGGEAAIDGDYSRSNQFFMVASDFSPDDMVIRQNLARSYQRLSLFGQAIDNYMYVLQNSDQNTGGLLETAVCMIECVYLSGQKEFAHQLAYDLIQNVESQDYDAKIAAWITINQILFRDESDECLHQYFHESIKP
jgi:tetratricopeptide (TPR) repeat protein